MLNYMDTLILTVATNPEIVALIATNLITLFTKPIHKLREKGTDKWV